MADLTMTEARRHLGAVVRRARTSGERITITDRGRPAAVLVSPEDLADLEEALALAELRAGQGHGIAGLTDPGSADASPAAAIPHAEVRRRLGLA